MKWTAKRKHAFMERYFAGEIASLADYGFSSEEFSLLVRRHRQHGLNGLKATKIRSINESHA